MGKTVDMKVSVEFTIKPGKGQSKAEAKEKFLKLFREYLTYPDNPFQTDYGPEAWGGYEGPTVTAVKVEGE